MSLNISNANEWYPDHLNGDPNYILCDIHMGTGWFVVRDSIEVETYYPPQYIITVDVARVLNADTRHNNTEISSLRKYRFFYNWDLRQMYVDKTEGDSDWYYINPGGCWAYTGIVKNAGEMAFYLAYNQKFYNIRIPDDFYDRCN